jgi:hypothetical protein
MRPSRQVIHGRQRKLYTSVMDCCSGMHRTSCDSRTKLSKVLEALNFPRDEAMEILSA